MTVTGPLPVIRETIPGDGRTAVLDEMGAPLGGIRYRYSTATAVIDGKKGILYIAVDPDPDPADWAAVVGLIRAVGWDNGVGPHHEDPGAPAFDALRGVWMWRLDYASR